MMISKYQFFQIYNFLISLKRKYRIMILIFLDQIILYFSIALAFFLNNGFSDIRAKEIIALLLCALPISIFFNIFTNQYKSKFSFPSGNFIFKIAIRNSLIVIIINIIDKLTFNAIFDLNVFITSITNSVLLSGFLKISIKDIHLKNTNLSQKLIKKNVVIYGAGSAGTQLAASLKLDPNYKIIAFIDDNAELHNRTIYGINVKDFSFISKNILKIDQFLIAIPSLKPSKLKIILDKLHQFKKPVLKVPTIENLFEGTHKINKFSYVSTKDLIGRDKAIPNEKLLKSKIVDQVVFVSGAGGSIGSELCRKIINLSPKALILFELSEHNLYKISQELESYNIYKLKLIKVLGNVCDSKLLTKLFSKFNVDVVFHAAAYKHVPLVELNPIQGVFNNVFSTYNLCKCAKKFKIKNFVLISTDKAVRPTNVMGASKRIAELIIQGFSQETSNTIFSIVRFGNVLNSSGSVFPLFKAQIEKRIPLTITDPKINRYFMTVSEAAELVIQSASLAEVGGDVFLLDMGEPIKIIDLAKKMIALSGLSVKDSLNADGDIEIKTIGLRPGEKLYEELLIDSSAESTDHPLIYKAKEKYINPEDLWKELERLKEELLIHNKEESFQIMSNLVPEWSRR